MTNMTDPEMVQRALQLVKQLIQKQEYDKARAILQRIEHPKKQEWLQRLDASVRRVKVNQGPKPFNPNFWAGMTIIISPLITSSVLGWNWRRLGKKGWTIPTILVSFLLVASIVVTLVTAIAFEGKTVFTSSVYGKYWLAAALLLSYTSYSFPFMIAGRQNKAIKLMEEKGAKAMRVHRYDWGRGMLMWAVNVGVIALLSVGISYLNGENNGLTELFQSEPEHFDDGMIALDIPSSWSIVDEDEVPACDYDFLSCRLIIHSRFDNAAAGFARVASLPGVTGPADVLVLLWDVIPPADRIEHGRYVISGYEAKYAKYITRVDGLELFTIDFMMVVHNRIFYISVLTRNEDIFDDQWQNNIKPMLDEMIWRP